MGPRHAWALPYQTHCTAIRSPEYFPLLFWRWVKGTKCTCIRIHVRVIHGYTYVYKTHIYTVYTQDIYFAYTLQVCVCMHIYMYAHEYIYKGAHTHIYLQVGPRTDPSPGRGGGCCPEAPLPHSPPRRCRCTGSHCSSAPDVTLGCPAGHRWPGKGKKLPESPGCAHAPGSPLLQAAETPRWPHAPWREQSRGTWSSRGSRPAFAEVVTAAPKKARCRGLSSPSERQD